jgi:hypothetical protein
MCPEGQAAGSRIVGPITAALLEQKDTTSNWKVPSKWCCKSIMKHTVANEDLLGELRGGFFRVLFVLLSIADPRG